MDNLKKFYVRIRFLFQRFVYRDPRIISLENELSNIRDQRLLELSIANTLNSFRIIKLKNRYKNKRCFVIGNGPSLKLDDLNKLKNEFTFASNKIYKIFNQTDWRPSFYFAEDSLIYETSYNDIKNIKSLKFISDIAIEYTKRPLINGAIMFYDSMEFLNIYPEYPPLTIDLRKKLFSAFNVSYAMINTAIYMGFKEIVLIGMDLNYNFSKAKPIMVKLGNNIEHGAFESNENLQNHFIKNYLEPGEKTHDTDTKYAKKAFELLEKESINIGIKIFNATRGGKLEAFERIDFDKLFPK